MASDEGGGIDSSVIAAAQVFKSLPKDGVARLADSGERRTFAEGKELMRQGEASTAMYVIVDGHVRVARMHPDFTEPLTLAIIGPGEVVGEMGVLDGEPRSATVIATDDVIAVELNGRVLGEIILQHPDIYGSLVRVLSRRLRSTDELAAHLGRDRRPDT